ncbi:lipoate--protein ligase family protein [Schlesneria sp.]|uniref:lipoate--protein ligase family protein n=1 Tax=Schlesneria sp. TaxID=2762018 RepID=UPI002F1D9FA1
MSDGHLPEISWPASVLGYDETLPTPADNLALEEALLADVEAEPAKACLRFWEPKEYFVVLGRSNRVETEVNVKACADAGIRIFRRASGGGTVLIGPGCLCYSLALPITNLHRTLGVGGVTTKLMERIAVALSQQGPQVEVCGTSDLVWNNQKFSGNAQRWLKNAFLHQGTLLYDFDLDLLARCLAFPSRQPDYRRGRSHRDFVVNIPLGSVALRKILSETWQARVVDVTATLRAAATKITETRYNSSEWQL